MADPKPNKPARPQLVISPDLEPVYTNVVRIAHSPAEMVFDFGRMLPGEKTAHVKTRVMMSPLSAKLLQRALAENLAKFEKNFGEIKIPAGGSSLADQLFKPPNGPDAPDTPEED
jgi:hypothetical protein